MPKINEYLCDDCRDTVDVFEGEDRVCPKCGKNLFKKLFSTFSISSGSGKKFDGLKPPNFFQGAGGEKTGTNCPICNIFSKVVRDVLNRLTRQKNN